MKRHNLVAAMGPWQFSMFQVCLHSKCILLFSGMPFAIKQSGLLLGLVSLFLVAALTDYSLVLLVKSGNISGTNTYQVKGKLCYWSLNLEPKKYKNTCDVVTVPQCLFFAIQTCILLNSRTWLRTPTACLGSFISPSASSSIHSWVSEYYKPRLYRDFKHACNTQYQGL